MWLRNTAWRRLGLFGCAGVVCCSPIFISPEGAAADKSQSKDKHTPPPLAVRWADEQPGCTFSHGDDGKYRYGLWSEDVGIILAVDARELQIIPHRNWPFFGAL